MKKSKYWILNLVLVSLLASCGKSSSEGSSSELSEVATTDQSSLVAATSSSPISEATMFTITFNSEGGTSVSPISAFGGETISRPVNPVKQGFNFVNWYEDKVGWTTPFVFDIMPSRNVSVFAKWESVGVDEIIAYNNHLAEISKPDHLYIHYLRFNNVPSEYNDWDIWVWPKNQTGRIFDFVKDGASVVTDNFGGAYIEIDLEVLYMDCGHDGNGNRSDEIVDFSTAFYNREQFGFLITYKSSRKSGGHWTSDGGDKYIVPNEALKYALNGSLHVFAVQENVRNFTYNYAGDVYDNPYAYDDGNNVSENYKDVNSSLNPRPISATSSLYKNKGVGYQIMVASFADSDNDGFGDILGITQSLDYLSGLNVEALWLTPIQLSDSYHGYDIIDYYNIDPKFGSWRSPHAIDGIVTRESAMEDYLDLIEEASSLGISVVMDLVINHTSINNLLFQESISLNPDFRAYYHWKNTKPNSNWYRYSNYEYYYYGKFASSMPELNFDYQATRDKIVDIMSHWVNLGVAGFRIDAVKHAYMKEEVATTSGDIIISDVDTTSGQNYSSNLTKNLHLFKEINAKLKAINPDVFIFGENFDGHAYNVAPYYEGFDGMLNFYSYYNLSQAVSMGGQDAFDTYSKAATVSGAYSGGVGTFDKGNLKYGGKWNYNEIYQTFNKYRANSATTLSGEAVDNNFTSNHDVSRAINQAIGWLNTAGDITKPGEVTTANKTLVEKQAIAYMGTILLLPGVSWIYYGDELGLSSNMPNGSDATTPNIDRIYRQPMKWDKRGNDERTAQYSFSGGETYKVKWDNMNGLLDGVAEQQNSTTSMFSRMQAITELKSSKDALKYGSYAPIATSEYASNNSVFAFSRTLNNETYKVYVNMFRNSINGLNINGEVVLSIEGASKNSLPAWSILVTKL